MLYIHPYVVNVTINFGQRSKLNISHILVSMWPQGTPYGAQGKPSGDINPKMPKGPNLDQCFALFTLSSSPFFHILPVGGCVQFGLPGVVAVVDSWQEGGTKLLLGKSGYLQGGDQRQVKRGFTVLEDEDVVKGGMSRLIVNWGGAGFWFKLTDYRRVNWTTKLEQQQSASYMCSLKMVQKLWTRRGIKSEVTEGSSKSGCPLKGTAYNSSSEIMF